MTDTDVQFIGSDGQPLPIPHTPALSDRAKVRIGQRRYICRVTNIWPNEGTDTMQVEFVPEEYDYVGVVRDL